MADLWKRRERAEKPADEFLNQKFGMEDYARAGNLGISMREKEISPEYYEECLAMFHALFAEHNEAYGVALWNTVAEICGSAGKGGRFDKADFTKEELEFIASVKKEVKKPFLYLRGTRCMACQIRISRLGRTNSSFVRLRLPSQKSLARNINCRPCTAIFWRKTRKAAKPSAFWTCAGASATPWRI